MKKIEILLLFIIALAACQTNQNPGTPATHTGMIYDTLPSLPDGTVYSVRQILQMAQNYSKAPVVVIDHFDNENVVVHCYIDNETNTETIDWLTINPNTGKGTDFLEQDIDFTQYLNE
ncbi:MAG: hypothetical protein J5701_01800 [Bacteroidales bacterium]|nr:hypothetical protein [Bacteroidales bacterium]